MGRPKGSPNRKKVTTERDVYLNLMRLLLVHGKSYHQARRIAKKILAPE